MKNKFYLFCLPLTAMAFVFFGAISKAQARPIFPLDEDGSVEHPYQISTCFELQKMNMNLTAHYELTQDVDCSATNPHDSDNASDIWNDGKGFLPIVTNIDLSGDEPDPSQMFSGTFNGNGHTINGLFIERTSADIDGENISLFGAISGTVENVNLADADITGYAMVGGIAGMLFGGTLDKVSIYGKVTSTGYVSAFGNMSFAGGLAGEIYEGEVTDSFSEVDVTATYPVTGGLAGLVFSSTVQRSYFSGNIECSDFCGGFAGIIISSIFTDSYAQGSVHGGDGVGGFVGLNGFLGEGGEIHTSYADVDVRATGWAGGFASDNENGSFYSDFSTGSVSSTSANEAGGFIGGNGTSGSYHNSGRVKQGDLPAIASDSNNNNDPIQNIGYDEDSVSTFYNSSFAIYHQTGDIWDFTNTWLEHSAALPTLKNMSSPDENNTDSSSPDSAKITSWDAFRYTDLNKSCSNRLKLTIKGKHFDKDAEVRIGGKEASSVDVKNSKKIVAKFCLDKLLSSDTDHKRKITVKNPDTDTEEADKQIDLDNISFNLSDNDFNPQTTQGIKNIQQALAKLGYLNAEDITGIYGSITTEAVKKFQTDNGIEPTGFVGPLTKAKLAEKLQ